MAQQDNDRELGMQRDIPRRDFISGVSLGLAGSLACPWSVTAEQPSVFAPEKAADYYPPALTGLRGNHPGSFEVGHQLRDGRRFDDAADTGEKYDVVIVGGGISGLAAALFYRQTAGAGARILVLDNHDDFGGHAKRNEFTSGGRRILGYGGTQSIDGPSTYSPESAKLLVDLGIETKRFYQYFDQKLYSSLGLGSAVFFDKETFGADRLVAGGGRGEGAGWWRDFAAKAPFVEEARKDFVRLHEDEVDYLPGLSADEKRAKLRRLSYRDFLRDYVKVHPQVIAYFQQQPHGSFGVGIDAMAALQQMGSPGFQGMGLSRPRRAESQGEREPYIFHFPDGNASVARLLVRSLVPGVAPGSTMEDVVTARFNYARLDDGGSPVRIRLNSMGVAVHHVGEPGASDVVVTYVRGGKAQKVSARHVVLACYHAVIPHLCPEIPAAQKEALLYGSKTPLIYTNVLIRNWTAFQKLRVSNIYGPATYFSSVSLDFPVSMGGYQCARTPEEPILLHLVRTPCKPGLPMRQQRRAGRVDMLQTTFETYERELRSQLGRTLSGGGFDPARDIAAITLNRWPHGYADEGDMLTDPEWTTDAEKPWVRARQRFGNITIANSDATNWAYTNSAIDQAHRAVHELLGGSSLNRAK